MTLVSKKHRGKSTGKRVVIVILIAVLIITAACFLFSQKKQKNTSTVIRLADTTELHYGNIETSIPATGTVESANSTLVYSTLTYKVKDVLVEVGDYVTQDQLLVELDTESIENQITSQEINLQNAQASSSIQVRNAQENYNNFKSALESGLNAGLINAQAQVDNAYDNYIRAQNTYDRFVESIQKRDNSMLLNAESALNSTKNAVLNAEDNLSAAEDSLRAARKAMNEASDLLEDGETALGELVRQRKALEQQLEDFEQDPEADSSLVQVELEQVLAAIAGQEAVNEQLYAAYQKTKSAYNTASAQCDIAERSLSSAEDSYETARASYAATLRTLEETKEDYETAMETAKRTYENALTTQESTEKSTNEQLQTYSNSVQSAQVGANTDAVRESIRQLQATLEDAEILAPCEGTVTAVYAEVGRSGSGLLFVIEDTENLIVDTSVKGYDVGTVQVGMKTRITSKATKKAEFDGIVTKIAPTSAKNMQGLTDTMGDPIFAAEVEITSKDTGLRIGMEAQLDYIVESQENVLKVPYDAVYTNAEGNSCVLGAVEQGESSWILAEFPVETGIEDDIEIVISGSGLTEGLRIVNDPDKYLGQIGKNVILSATAAADNPYVAIMAEMGGF